MPQILRRIVRLFFTVFFVCTITGCPWLGSQTASTGPRTSGQGYGGEPGKAKERLDDAAGAFHQFMVANTSVEDFGRVLRYDGKNPSDDQTIVQRVSDLRGDWVRFAEFFSEIRTAYLGRHSEGKPTIEVSVDALFVANEDPDTQQQHPTRQVDARADTSNYTATFWVPRILSESTMGVMQILVHEFGHLFSFRNRLLEDFPHFTFGLEIFNRNWGEQDFLRALGAFAAYGIYHKRLAKIAVGDSVTDTVKVRNSASPQGLLNFSAFGGAAVSARVAVGYLNTDAIPDIVVASGPGIPVRARVFDGETGQQLRDSVPYGPFSAGAYVAIGDVNGDQRGDIVLGADATGSARIIVLDGRAFVDNGTVTELASVEVSEFQTWGVRVAAGDINGDGYADVVTSPGPGGGPHIQILSGERLRVNVKQVIASFWGYSLTTYSGGVYVAAGNLVGDARADVVVSTDQSAQPHVRVFPAEEIAANSGAPTATVNFYGFDAGHQRGARPAIGNVFGDGPRIIVSDVGWPALAIFTPAGTPLTGAWGDLLTGASSNASAFIGAGGGL